MEIYLIIDQQESGPHTEEEVRMMVRCGRISRECLAWCEGIADWQPVNEVVRFPELPPLPHPPSRARMPAELPPLPPISPVRPPAKSSARLAAPESSVIKTASGIIALVLVLLAVFNIGGCINAQQKLATFQSGSDPQDGVQMLVETYRGASDGDPLRGLAGLFEKSRTLNEDLEGFQVGAWLCVAGALVSGGVFAYSKVRAVAPSLG